MSDITFTTLTPQQGESFETTIQRMACALALQSPASDLDVITPSDATVLSDVRSLWVGGTGDVVVVINGNERTIVGVPAGTLLPISGVTKVKVATTASNILALK